MPRLYMFAGLPGVGKTTLAQRLARTGSATLLRIDTIEQGLRDLCGIAVEGEGYRLAYRIAADNLRLGRSVVADACNTIHLVRSEWQQVALDGPADFIPIEVICSDTVEHRRRVETRTATVPGLRLPSWEDVRARHYEDWEMERIVIDTAGRSVDASVAHLRDAIAAWIASRAGGEARSS